MLSLGHDLPTFGLLLWTSIPCYPALWGGPHSPIPAFDKRIEKLLISPLRSHPIPIGLSAPPSLRPPNSASILAVLNRCLLLTRNEEMDAKKHRNMFLTGAERVAGGQVQERGAKVWVLEPMLSALGVILPIWSWSSLGHL